METMNYITILDFEEGQVFQYKISVFHDEAWNPDSESCEEFMIEKGHNIHNCQWMVHKDEGIIYPIKT